MQRVISRVHQIVTANAAAETAAPSPSPPPSSSSPSTTSTRTPSTSTAPSNAIPATTTTGSAASPPTLGVASTPKASPPPSSTAARDITLAVERLQFATLLGERKRAVASLHELVQQHAGALGIAAAPVVLAALISDPRDTELMEALLELLQALVVASPDTAAVVLDPSRSSTPGMQICLQLLTDPSPWIRGPTVTLVKLLQEAQPTMFATSVLECKEGLRRLLEVVEDKREHIRDAALQILAKLTEREKSVQQFLAFEDGFVRLFQIMETEGLVEGSSVVADCLQIVNNMVRDNIMTQTLFRELPHLVSDVPRLLSLPVDTSEATPNENASVPAKFTQKKRTVKLALQLIRFLVSGLYEGVPDAKLDEAALRDRARKALEKEKVQSFLARQSKLMGAIGDIVCCDNESVTDLRLQALDLIQLICTGNGGNQIILVNLSTISSRRSLLAELIRLDIQEDETPVAAAATNLLDALFTENESSCMAVFQQLNAPPPIDDDQDPSETPPTPAGQVLLDAIIENAEAIMNGKVLQSLRRPTVAVWKAAHRLSSLLAGSDYCKQLGLRVPADYKSPDSQAVAGDLLLTRCLRVMTTTSSTPRATAMSTSVFQVRVALLTLLIHWCVDCPRAVHEIVGSITNLSALIELLSSSSESATSKTISKESASSIDERNQIKGLAAMLLGCCLEFLIDASRDDTTPNGSMPTHGGRIEMGPYRGEPKPIMTRQQLLDVIGNKVGLEAFSRAFILFQQSPSVVACGRASRNHASRTILAQHALFSGEDGMDHQEHGAYLFPLYDKTFVQLYRDLSDRVQKRVIEVYTSASTSNAGDVTAPSAVSAYQDLIRIQDKQIHDLQQELAAAKQLPTGASTIYSSSGGKPADVDLQLDALRAEHATERTELERQLATITEHSAKLEARMHGLVSAFEALEKEHLGCLEAQDRNHVNRSTSNPSDVVSRLTNELEHERAARRQVEDKLRETEDTHAQQYQRALADRHEWEITQMRLNQEVDRLRVELEEKEEQVNSMHEMVSVMKSSHDLTKRDMEQLKLELESIQQTSSTATAVPGTTSQEIYQLYEKEKMKSRELKEENTCFQQEIANLRQQLSHNADVKEQTANPHIAAVEELTERVKQLEEQKSDLQAKLDGQHENHKQGTGQLHAVAEQQLAEIQELRNVMEQMEASYQQEAAEVAAKNAQIQQLTDRIAVLESTMSETNEKHKATVTELEGEVTRMFQEKLDAHRKAKAAMKELEEEIARMFFEKVRMEERIAELSASLQGQDEHNERPPEDTDDTVESPSNKPRLEADAHDLTIHDDHVTSSTQEDERQDVAIDSAIADQEAEDLFILLASLEIQCNTFREKLLDAKGDKAVADAVELAKKRGAMVV